MLQVADLDCEDTPVCSCFTIAAISVKNVLRDAVLPAIERRRMNRRDGGRVDRKISSRWCSPKQTLGKVKNWILSSIRTMLWAWQCSSGHETTELVENDFKIVSDGRGVEFDDLWLSFALIHHGYSGLVVVDFQVRPLCSNVPA